MYLNRYKRVSDNRKMKQREKRVEREREREREKTVGEYVKVCVVDREFEMQIYVILHTRSFVVLLYLPKNKLLNLQLEWLK